MNIPVIYEDEWFLVADKPAGLLVVPTPKRETRTLTSILNEDALLKGYSCRLYPCHRLDRDTSGLIIYAKGKAARKKMEDIFRERKIKKSYFSLVSGIPPKKESRITALVFGLSATTDYRVVKKWKDFSELEVNPLTGRTNQIRLHLKQLGCPILGDYRFALRRDFKIKAKRLCLHAKSLEFTHPFTGSRICLEAPLPQDLRGLLQRHHA
ncbi:MAG: RluA family pseudouridine synthase [Candidatus Omnitrophota bacterium]